MLKLLGRGRNLCGAREIQVNHLQPFTSCFLPHACSARTIARDKIRQLRAEQKSDRDSIKRLNERLQQLADVQTHTRFKSFRARPRPLAFSVGDSHKSGAVSPPMSKSSPSPGSGNPEADVDKELYKALNLDFDSPDRRQQELQDSSVLQEVPVPDFNATDRVRPRYSSSNGVEKQLEKQLEELEKQ